MPSTGLFTEMTAVPREYKNINGMMKKMMIGLFMITGLSAVAQQTSLVNTGSSPHAKLSGIGLADLHWTKGFWAERFAICRDSMLPHLWSVYNSKDSCYAFENFRIAAGLDTGYFRGPSFSDGDFYKVLEAAASVYALTKDHVLDAQMDAAIAVIGKAQRADGYIYTKSLIEQLHNGQPDIFNEKLSFEAYNFGHLMTAACVHYRATGKTNLLDIAKKATDFLIAFYDRATPEQARNAICPSHYMGITEMYRTTGQQKYLSLVKKLIDIRGTTEGTNDNSDREPFREMETVEGHAVRANYLFAGAADVYAETGDKRLLSTLDKMWDDVVNHKMYVTGGCGALYDGVAVAGQSYNPDTVQSIHQAYGQRFQLPNFSAHNETCANIGNLLWNWRMLQVTGQARYADIVELELYNSVLSGVSLGGTSYFYTNPLAASAAYPYHLRWEGGRQPYIPLSNCCPPNALRTLAEVGNYMYSVAGDGLYVNLYGGNRLSTTLPGGASIVLEQQTDYPWSGAVHFTLEKVPATAFNIHFRLPGWCNRYSVAVNGKRMAVHPEADGYINLHGWWKAGDAIELLLDMPAVLLESNPLVEETRNQVAVKRGPVVYCLESADLPGQNVFDIRLPATARFSTARLQLNGAHITTLNGEAILASHRNWNDVLYKELDTTRRAVHIKLIPYYAWANRGPSDMTVWMPVN